MQMMLFYIPLSTQPLTVAMILQADLLTSQKWSETWQMEFNPSKCEHLQITNKHNFIDTHYTLYGHMSLMLSI